MRLMGERAAKDALFDGFAEVAKALASGRRAEIVDVLAQGERSVDEISDEIGQSVANTSHHLRAMARAGLLSTRRDGTRIYYALAGGRVEALWAALRDVAAEHVAGIERLTEAYLGDRDGLEAISRGEVAVDPHRNFHFHTGRPLAAPLGYDQAAVDALPDRAVESFAGVGHPFALRQLAVGERVVDVGSGAGFDSFIAAGQVGDTGQVIGVDMTPEMLEKSRETADALGFAHVEFREGLAESLPVDDGWADAVIS